jgi:hypothetical protein
MPHVVKVGGSLYEWPALGPKLARWLRENAPGDTILAPGGGPFVECVRRLDHLHKLGDEVGHWLALSAMSTAARFVRRMLAADCPEVLDALEFCRADDRRPGALPHSWHVTSDSIAARLAELRGTDLILLKSAEPPAGGAAAWAAAGYVDAFFPTIVERAKLAVRAINLRAV